MAGNVCYGMVIRNIKDDLTMHIPTNLNHDPYRYPFAESHADPNIRTYDTYAIGIELSGGVIYVFVNRFDSSVECKRVLEIQIVEGGDVKISNSIVVGMTQEVHIISNVHNPDMMKNVRERVITMIVSFIGIPKCGSI